MREGLWKAEGSGNDFIVGSGPQAERLEQDEDFIRRLCDRRRGIGADGVLALSATEAGRIRLVYRNADASKASFCANGSRVAALAAFDLLGMSSPILLETDWKTFGVERTGEEITLHLPPPDDSGEILRLESGPDSFEGFFIRFGVPHFLIRIPAAFLRSSDLAATGLRLRSHPDFGPSGANISFYHLSEKGNLEIRSFERGVSQEVLSCGSAMAAAAWRETRDGEVLSLLPKSGDFLSANRTGTGLNLQGPARIIARIEDFELP